MAQSYPTNSVQMAHVVNLISIAMIDGSIAEEEKNLIFQIASDLGLTKDEFQQCIDISQKAKNKVVYEVPEGDSDRLALLKNLTLMMMIDGRITARERQYLVILAEKFGFDGEKAVDLLIQHINNEIRQNLADNSETISGEAPTEEAPTEETPTGGEHKLIAIIKTDGKADILEFDVENWDELPGFVDADRLDAIRVQPLYDISKKLGYSEHITGWVDNKGLLRDLPSNPIGCKIYPGNIVGDMILTLEDASYKPMSFTNLDDLKQVVADLDAELVNVFLD